MAKIVELEPRKEPRPDDWGPREFSTIGFGAYRLAVPRATVKMEIARLRRERGELVGELTVWCEFAGARTFNGIVSCGDFNCSSIDARGKRAKHLAYRALTQDIDWEGWLHEFCIRVMDAERLGNPAALLTDIPIEQDGGEFNINGWTLPRREPAIIFGDGGSAKSLLTLWAAGQLAQQGELVLYADWEATGSDHHQRLCRLFPSGQPPILYTRCDQPLIVEAERLRKLIVEHGITYIVCDSAAYGCHGAPESAEAVIGYFRALRSLGQIGSAIIAHVTKAEEGNKRPFGSAFWHNSARATWNVARSNPDEANDVQVMLSHRKHNDGRLLQPFTWNLNFGETIQIRQVANGETVPELAISLNLKQRIESIVRRGPIPLEELRAEFGDETPDNFKKTLQRLSAQNVIVKFQKPPGPLMVAMKSQYNA